MGRVGKLAAWCCGWLATAAVAADDWQVWNSLALQTQLGNGRYLAFLELAPRYVDGPSRLGQFIIHPLLGLNLTENLQFFLGYTWQGEHDPVGDAQFDNATQDVVEQVQWLDDVTPYLNLSYRVRLEQRLFADANPGHRLRHRLRAQYSLPETDFFLVTSQELFFYLNSLNASPRAFIVQPGFNQSRSYFGVGYRVSHRFVVDTGYLVQHINLFGMENQTNSVWLSSFTVLF